MERARASLGGRPALVRLCLAATAAALALTGLVLGAGEEALRSGMRTTARLAVVVFALAFAALLVAAFAARLVVFFRRRT